MALSYSNAPWPAYDDEQIEAVERVLRSGRVNYWTGNEGREFEREFAEYTGVDYAVFVANGTLALELAIASLELPTGSQVVTTPRTYIASSSAIIRNGLRPVFADVDPESGNITRQSIEKAITPETSAVLVVHLGGWPADMLGIKEVCQKHGLKLIEDCAQAHGAMIGDRHVGTFGDVAAWSFCQDKIITTGGEGGMIATDEESLWRRIWAMKDIGRSFEAVYEREHPPGFRWLHESIGTNARGTEMQAAIGRIQYRRLDSWRNQRTVNAMTLAKMLTAIPELHVPMPSAGVTHGFYRLYGRVDLKALQSGWTRDRIVTELAESYQVPIFSGSCSEVYREKAISDLGLSPEHPLPNAQRWTDDSLAFLVHPGLTESDLYTLYASLAQVIAQACQAPVGKPT